MRKASFIITPSRRSGKQSSQISSSGGNHLKVKSNQREYECFQILYEIVEDTETFRVVGLLHVDQGTDLGGLCCGVERDISFQAQKCRDQRDNKRFDF